MLQSVQGSEKLKASLLLLGGNPIPCVVTNVTPAGVELTLEGQSDIFSNPTMQSSYRAGATAALLITPDNEAPWQIQGQFYMQQSGAIELHYGSSPPPEANQLARLFREIRAGNIDIAGVLDRLEKCANDYTRKIYESFLFHADEELFVLAKDTASMQEQTDLLATRNQINASKTDMLEVYATFIRKQIRDLKSVSKDNPDISNSRLSLLEDNVLEDFLDVKEIVRDVYDKFCVPVVLIHQRFESLLGVTLSDDELPVSPEFLCDAFRKSLKEIETSQDILHEIYRLYGQALLETIDGFYQDFSGVLVDAGVLPDLEISQRQALQMRQERMDRAVGGETSLVGSESIFDSSSDLPEDIPVNTLQSSPESLYQTVRTLMSISKKNEHVQQAQSGVAPLSNDELLNVIGALETSIGFADINEQNGGLKEAIKDQLDVGSDGKGLSLPQDDAIELFEDMFDAIIQGNEVDESFKSKILLLKTPLLKRVILDETFFASRKNPARVLLNQLTQLGGFASILTNKVLEQVDQIISMVKVASPVDNQVMFGLSNQIQSLIDRQDELRARQVDRVVDIHRGKEKLALANHEVDSLIKRYATEGATLPQVVVQLFNAGLRQYFLLTWINEGKESDAWRDGVKGLRTLLSWVQGCEDGSCLAHRLEGVDTNEVLDIINHIDRAIESVSSGVAEHKPLLSELATVLIDRQFKYDSLQEMPVAEVENYHEPEDADEQVDPKDARLLSGIDVDDWISLPDAPPRNAIQLVWMSHDKTDYVFANRAGKESGTMSPAKLAELIREGWQINKSEGEAGAVDRGIYATLQHVYQELAYQRCHDELTGLINRREFERMSSQILHHKGEATNCYMLVLDIDQFDLINSLCGHHMGDELLINVAEMMQEILPNRDYIARIGSNEFGAVIKNSSEEEAKQLTEDLRQRISAHPFQVGGRSYEVTASFGLAHIDETAISLASILRRASSACSMAKEMGRNRVVVYKEGDKVVMKRKSLEEWYPKINEAISNNTLYLKVQKIEPNVDAIEAELPHYEVLLGLNDSDDKPIPIWEFIQAAEHFKRMEDVDRWVVDAVFKWINDNPEKMDLMDCISINLAGTTLGNEDFLEFLLEKFETLSIDSNRVCFEITETSAIENIDKAISFISELKNIGCLFSLDDFGTGFSSYEYLKRLPVDYLKIDGVFIKSLTSNPDDQAVVRSMCEIGHYMNKKIVAEFVETEDIRNVLKTIGVDYVQGYGVEMPKEIVQL